MLSVGTLVQEAIEAFLQNEMETEHHVISEEPESSGEQSEVSIFPNFDLGSSR